MVGETSPTGPPGEPLEALLEAIELDGWTIELNQQVFDRSTNPTRLDLLKGNTRRRLLVYSWFATDEGKGRKKRDYRIQTTRPKSDQPLLEEPGRTTVGFGWDRRRRVFAVFDGWTKRLSGKSTAVHTRDALLIDALEHGWAVDGLRWDPRATFTPENVGKALDWVVSIQQSQREAPVKALDGTSIEGDQATIIGDVWRSGPAPWLRKGDRLIATDGKEKLVDDSLWRVEEIEPFKVQTDSGSYNRTHIRFRCRRVGTVHAEDVVEILSSTGRPAPLAAHPSRQRAGRR